MPVSATISGVLRHPSVYVGVQRALGADRLRRICLDEFAQLRPGERVLDLGCGPGYIRELMPAVDYVGFDTESRYIEYARKRYSGRGSFHCAVFNKQHAISLGPFDAILLFGVLHHIDDNEARILMELMSGCLRKHGRVVTLDPCFTTDQSRWSRRVAESDRGRFVRTATQYDALVEPFFADISAEVFHNVCRIPSTERIMALARPRGVSGSPVARALA